MLHDMTDVLYDITDVLHDRLTEWTETGIVPY